MGAHASELEHASWYSAYKGADELLLQQHPLSQHEVALMTALFTMEYNKQFKHWLSGVIADMTHKERLMRALTEVVGALDIVVERVVRRLSVGPTGLKVDHEMVIESYAAFMRTCARKKYDEVSAGIDYMQKLVC